MHRRRIEFIEYIKANEKLIIPLNNSIIFIIKVVILTRRLGTRLTEETDVWSKSMVEIVGMPNL
jgi:hypothetical protein